MSGIYIPCDKIPAKCKGCSFVDPEYGGDCILMPFASFNTYEEQFKRCPFKEIVKRFASIPPHGRLIDADALVEKIDGIWDCNDMVFRPNDKICKIPEDCRGCKWVQTKDCIQRMAENAPTIIPAEEGET